MSIRRTEISPTWAKCGTLALFLVISLSLTGCAFIQDKTGSLFSRKDEKHEDSNAQAETRLNPTIESQAQDKPALGSLDSQSSPTHIQSIELTWAIPPQPVEGFVIHYGSSKDSLTQEVRLLANELEKFEDPDKGFVYRYLLSKIEPKEKIYVAVSAYNGELSSPLSEVKEVNG